MGLGEKRLDFVALLLLSLLEGLADQVGAARWANVQRWKSKVRKVRSGI